MNKLKVLAAAMAFAVAGSANAALVLPNTGNSSLILTAWDNTTNESYIRDLGYNLLDFVPSAVTPDAGLTIDFAVDPLFASLFGDNDAANVQWNITAADSFGSGAVSGRQLIGTGAYGADVSTFSVTNTGVANTSNYMNGFFGNANTQPNVPGVDLGTCSTSSSCYSIDNGDLQYTGDQDWGVDWGGNLTSWNNSGFLGETLGFYSMTPSNTLTFSQASKETFANINGLASWVLSADGSLVYSVPGAVSAVPVPAAAWLFGSGLLGLVGVARRRNV